MIRSALLVGTLLAGAAAAQTTPPVVDTRGLGPVPERAALPPGPIAMERPETQGPNLLIVTSPVFTDGAPIPPRYSRYYANLSPPIGWRGAPRRAVTYALIVDDPDGRLKPVTHWTVWNIKGTSLPEAVPVGAIAPSSVAASQGLTTMRINGYAGPHPPLGDPPHHYHFQVFALDTVLTAAPGADRETLLAAMQGHVIARGELIGLYGQAQATGK